MTIGTDSRNITKIIRALLKKYDVDNLELEASLVGSMIRYVNERDAGETPAQARERVAGDFLEVSFLSAEALAIQKAKQTFEDVMKLNSGNSPQWDELFSFLARMEAQGQTIAQYSAWCQSDPFNSPKAHQIAQKPLLVKSTWRMAFEKKESDKPRAKLL